MFPVIHLPGITAGQMVLDGLTLSKIYLGEITKWNDPAIKKLNPKLNLPDHGHLDRAPLGWLGNDV